MANPIEISGRAIESCTFESYRIKQIRDWHKRRMLNLSPGYQRSGVWTLSERSRLIDTIFGGYPIPTVILHERTDVKTHKKVYDAIDGKQRLETILYFMGELSGVSNRFVAKVGNRVDGETILERVTWRGLSDKSQREFLEYEVPCVIVQSEFSEIPDIFVRLNSTGKKLSRQEIRNAKYIKSPFLREMRAFSRKMDRHLQNMGVLNETEISRMKDIEFLSELVISAINGCVIDKKRLLDQMMTPGGVDMRCVKKAMNIIANAIKLVEKVLPDIAATRFRKFSDFYSLVSWFALRKETVAIADTRSQKLAGELLRKFGLMADNAYEELKNGKLKEDDARIVSYVHSVQGGSDSKGHRQDREKILSEVLEGVFEEKDSKRLFSGLQRRIVWGLSKNHKCCVCHRQLSWPDFEVDHIKPHSKGGKTELSNAALICKNCNAAKGNRFKA